MRRFLAVTVAVAVATVVSAQGPRELRGATPGEFDFYVLALTWSPGFCALEGARRARSECEPGRAAGFAVHGLWPQLAYGYPAECDPFGRMPSGPAREAAQGLFPDDALARHEWRRHGTCSGKSPAEYFRDVRTARDRIVIPELFRDAPRDAAITPAEIERAFAAANPGLRPDMMAVICRRGVLQEVRICFDRTLRGFRRCPEVDRGGCRFGDIRLEAAR